MFLFITTAIIIWLLIPVGVILYFLFEAFARDHPTGIGLDETLPTRALIGMEGIVTRKIVLHRLGERAVGQIRIGMMKHRAIAEKEIWPGKEVKVVHAEGITLTVEEKTASDKEE